MRNTLLAAIVVALAVAAPAEAEKKNVSGLMLLETESRVEVDSQGKVVSVHTTPEMPLEILAIVEAKVRALHFAPAHKDGRAVGGVTWVQQDACAAPENGAYRFAVQYRGNGPSLEQKYAPAYPRDAMRAGVESKWKVSYSIGADGKARLLEATREKGTGRPLNDREFRSALANWIDALKFKPEIVDGQAVATQVSDEVEFVLTSVSGSAARERAERERKLGSDACKLALAERDATPRRVALDSPFKPIAAN